ncbi:unnamed protein product, partial [Ectocarpus fasciculatus]
ALLVPSWLLFFALCFRLENRSGDRLLMFACSGISMIAKNANTTDTVVPSRNSLKTTLYRRQKRILCFATV